MYVIYSPKGRAGEYGKLACNIYLRCEHKCLYCYCPQALRITREEFFKAPVPRLDFLKKLEVDARALNKKGIKENIFLSFIGDPYQPINDKYHLTRDAIQMLHHYGMRVTILTKGGKRAEQDFDLLGPKDAFATTLTLVTSTQSVSQASGGGSWPRVGVPAPVASRKQPRAASAPISWIVSVCRPSSHSLPASTCALRQACVPVEARSHANHDRAPLLRLLLRAQSLGPRP